VKVVTRDRENTPFAGEQYKRCAVSFESRHWTIVCCV